MSHRPYDVVDAGRLCRARPASGRPESTDRGLGQPGYHRLDRQHEGRREVDRRVSGGADPDAL